MKFLTITAAIILYSLVFPSTIIAEIFFITSQQEFNQAQNNAQANDSIIWKSGTYSDIYMEIENDDLFIGAEILGRVIFSGASRVEMTGDDIVFEGFQFIGGDIGTRDVINIRGSNCIITQINIRAYTCYKYLRVRESSQYVSITYCNFENRLNLDDQNILSILVDETNPGYHKIQYCSFKNFDGTGNDLGIEPIRIGLSTQADFISRTLVEYCYFTQCNGDGELISSKASQNVYRHNTFENNPLAELVLRHGSENIVYSNFFLNGKGGVRVREGQHQYIYNNYFYELDDRAIFLQNEDSDPLDDINIAFNTIVDCSEVILGGDGDDQPTNVTFSNNIFFLPDDDLFEEQTGTETWLGNIAFGSIGIPQPSSGFTITNPQLESNSEGFFGLRESSPAINEARSGYKPLPQFEGIDGIDSEVLFDLMGQNRPVTDADKDIGASEFPHILLIQPRATEENTGPSYNTTTINSFENTLTSVTDLIELNPNPVLDQLHMTIKSQKKIDLEVVVFDITGKKMEAIFNQNGFLGETQQSAYISTYPAGTYSLRAIGRSHPEHVDFVQYIKFIKL